jgi:sulfate adenylyltransferase subunit 1
MVTGVTSASFIILIDARKGVIEQNVPSPFLSIILLRVKEVIVAVNKMDRLIILEEVYNKIKPTLKR